MISQNEFNDCCELFLEKESEIPWKKTYYEGILTLVGQNIIPRVVLNDQTNSDLSYLEEDFDEEDDVQCTSITPQGMWHFNYHIVYSLAFSVPVLYFNATDEKGKAMTYDNVWSLINCKNKWETVTQGMHPFLGTPFFYFHPCKTNELLNLIKQSHEWKNQFLSSFLNIYGHTIGICCTPT